ncbi:MAG: TnsA endonuclease N-terminal domain-containing protein [Cellvibrio sp.]|uniref:TnsA endonuclease N-terminal domain-containing protein n=1 Tax=Cellvibrio sp. TaxID=1965322 RepID=UPI0031A19A25
MYNTNLGFDKQIKEAFKLKPDLGGIIHGSERRVFRGARDRVISSFPSRKIGGALLLEGELERATAICLESSNIVSRYITQSMRIRLSAKHYVIPDFLVERCDRSHVVIEVKPSIKGLPEEKRERYALCSELLKREGIEFRIIDSYILPTRYKFYELKTFYLRGHQHHWSPDAQKMAMQILNEKKIKKIQSGRLQLISEGLPGELCDYLVFHKHYSFIDASNNTVEIAA